ncbi:MAG: hypothetical protein GY758_08050 [Fuerstiella sp.]|jgi:hypothetical protein|nr:hypothetical protein [Fuerstiella sp.]MCP4513102.1 hypothetical protein [Fuerstiella sp.]MCP4855597.1 hypothetical protein [Fuerstiella sp.]MDG2131674.1 hypothetical protein [Fuerstiella sp.]
MWADGIHCNVHIRDNEGRTKDLNAVVGGRPASGLSWKEVLLSLQARGVVYAPESTIGDGEHFGDTSTSRTPYGKSISSTESMNIHSRKKP